MFFITLFLANTWRKNRGSPRSFKRRGEFIPLWGLVWGKSLTFCACARRWRETSCAAATRHANTKGLPRVQPQMRYDWLITSLKREGYRSFLKYFWKEKFWKVRVTSEQAPLSTWFFQPRQEMNSNLIVDLLACSWYRERWKTTPVRHAEWSNGVPVGVELWTVPTTLRRLAREGVTWLVSGQRDR